MSPDDFSPAALDRALVIKLRHHGDVLLSSPVFTALKRAAPQCEIDALVYADTAPMLAGHPLIARLHTIDRGWKRLGPLRQAVAEWGLLTTLRERGYDLVIHLTEHTRGAWLTRLLAPRWSVAPQRPGRFWRGSFSHFVAAVRGYPRHTVDCNLDALRRLGIQPAPAERALLLVPGQEAQARVDGLLAAAGLAAERFVHVHPASRWLFKCWPADRTAQLIDALQAAGWPVVLSCAPDAAEQRLTAAIVAGLATPPALNLAGQLTLKELAALTMRARLFVGVDSAPMHIAAAVGTPAVALFGPSGEHMWGPWGTPRHGRHIVVRNAAFPCGPCGIDGCGGGKVSECLVTLPVEQVLAACRQNL
jgi:heptosyltransferase-3